MSPRRFQPAARGLIKKAKKNNPKKEKFSPLIPHLSSQSSTSISLSPSIRPFQFLCLASSASLSISPERTSDLIRRSLFVCFFVCLGSVVRGVFL
ncbi:uncharacterized protein K452DRAFT_79755 [Aplosporella prunicola CBS 121167]|uniref:Uncharacterized protein n=1 Tax=Aplosporella prunicola CBS 121167 TaxID=1176127 RepID=A0A6A6B4G2_9PEZI|nr:uncharacterized protein K452DRAFT_79755 [Aplosporella prunicola CBS 121167]KAF2139022.1 hypothetical protein K452DRAFT_79755 [Aplosporella prunicola CBS 121167]